MRKFFVNSNCIFEDKIKIIGSDVNHIKNVLRLKNGDKIQICNKDTSENYICELSNIETDFIEMKIIENIKSIAEGNVELHIFQGLPKADKMELIIQKGTELGVSKFWPVSFKRCVVKISGKDEIKKIERWNKIAEVAAKQSQRDLIPEVSNIMTLKNICDLINNYDIVLLAYENEENNYIKNELLKLKNSKEKLKIAVIIGPEGGIEKEEVQILEDSGCKVISLGKRILRTETVALQTTSIIMYELEN